MPRTTAPGWTRREALELLGMSAAAAALPGVATAQTDVTFPKGAIIRTVLKDYAPEELAGGATLFHEHMSFAADFMPRWMKFAAETRAANAPTRRRRRSAVPRRRRARGAPARRPPAPSGDVLHAGRRSHDRGIEHRQARRHRLHRRRRPPRHGTRRQLSCARFRSDPGCRSSPAAASTRSRSTRKRSRR